MKGKKQLNCIYKAGISERHALLIDRKTVWNIVTRNIYEEYAYEVPEMTISDVLLEKVYIILFILWIYIHIVDVYSLYMYNTKFNLMVWIFIHIVE